MSAGLNHTSSRPFAREQDTSLRAKAVRVLDQTENATLHILGRVRWGISRLFDYAERKWG